MAGSTIIGGVRNSTDSGMLCLPVGPSLTIAITDGDRGASWRIDLDVELTATGSFRLGTVITSPPAVVAPPARVVAVAFCPGAERWRIFSSLLAGAARSQAELEISTSPCCPAFVGMLPVYPFSTPGHARIDTLAAVVVGAVGVPTVLSATLPARSVLVQADFANTDPVWVGGSTVTVGTGIELQPGMTEAFDIERAELLFAIASQPAQVVRVQVLR